MPRPSLRPDGSASPAHTPRFRRVRVLIATLSAFALFGLVSVIIAGWGFYAHVSANLPSIEALQHYHPPVVSRLYTNNDRVMAELSHERRIYVPISAVPPRVRNAFIAAEDQNFYNHGGVDYFAIARAGLTDLVARHGKRPLGASTITQQVAKSIVLNDNVLSITRKVREALLAMRMEQVLSKDRILEIYLNGIYLGNGSYGVEAASQSYFNKSLDQLTNAEAAMLGTLPKSPNNYNPFRHPKTALWRRNWVLDRMNEIHVITPQEAEEAKQEPLVPKSRRRPGPMPTSEWFATEVRRQLIARYGEEQTTEGGLDVHTSLDPHLQEVSTRILRNGLIQYDRTHEGWRGPLSHLDDISQWEDQLSHMKAPAGMLAAWRLAIVLSPEGEVGWIESEEARHATLRKEDIKWSHRRPVKSGDIVMVEPQSNNIAALQQIPHVEGAAVTMDAHTGRVLSMVGGWSFQQSWFNRATQAQRQPGSSFKPLVYLAALEHDISPSETFDDSPISFGNWHPKNYEHNNWGPTTLHDALRESRNLVTIRVAAHLGMDAVGDMTVRSGMVDRMPPYLPAALGAVETTILREAGAYAAIANGGHIVTPNLIDYIQDPVGNVIWRAQDSEYKFTTENGLPIVKDQRPILASPESTFQLQTMMTDAIKRGTGRLAGVGIDRPIGGKTGTTQDYRDAWFAGFSPDLVTVVWVGYDAPRSLGRNQTGGRIAGPIWNQIMKTVFTSRPPLDFPAPKGMTLAQYDTGHIRAIDAFKPGQIPGASVPLHGFGSGTQALTASDTGADTIPDSENSMSDDNTPPPPPSSTLQEGENGNVPPPNAHENSESGDIGVGGLY